LTARELQDILKIGPEMVWSKRVKPNYIKTFPAWFIFCISACILLSSCATSLETVMSRYREAPACCKVYDDFNYERLTIPDSRTFWINEGAKAFIFATGKSYFKAFELPVYSSPYAISNHSISSARQ
jgi:hypothetical protein